MKPTQTSINALFIGKFRNSHQHHHTFNLASSLIPPNMGPNWDDFFSFEKSPVFASEKKLLEGQGDVPQQRIPLTKDDALRLLSLR